MTSKKQGVSRRDFARLVAGSAAVAGVSVATAAGGPTVAAQGVGPVGVDGNPFTTIVIDSSQGASGCGFPAAKLSAEQRKAAAEKAFANGVKSIPKENYDRACALAGIEAPRATPPNEKPVKVPAPEHTPIQFTQRDSGAIVGGAVLATGVAGPSQPETLTARAFVPFFQKESDFNFWSDQPPTSTEVQTILTNAVNWVGNQVRKAPESSGQEYTDRRAVSMYQGWPLTAKVPLGNLIPDAQSYCDYVRHMGSEFTWMLSYYPYMETNPAWRWVTVYERSENKFQALCEIAPWSDGQPPIQFQVYREEDGYGNVRIGLYYGGKPSSDTRAYPVQIYFEDTMVVSDHRTAGAGWKVWELRSLGHGTLGNKYFIRTEDQVAAKLLQGMGNADGDRLETFSNFNYYTDISYDIHAPLFNWSSSLPDDFMFSTSNGMYADCGVTNDGCPQGWHFDRPRWDTDAGWGFSHRSKVCEWTGGYTWILRQDPLGLLSQAIHVMQKYNSATHSYANPWPSSVPNGPSGSTVTPAYMVEWVWEHFWQQGQGCSMFEVPIIGGDKRASSLRTNQMMVAATLLGYRYNQGNSWKDRADTVAAILQNVQVGGKGQPSRGVWSWDSSGAKIAIRRSGYFGSQMFVWAGDSPAGVVDFSWLRTTINEYFNLPHDDEDYMLSTVETTATYAQAWRTYLYYKHNVLSGTLATIPGQ